MITFLLTLVCFEYSCILFNDLWCFESYILKLSSLWTRNLGSFLKWTLKNGLQLVLYTYLRFRDAIGSLVSLLLTPPPLSPSSLSPSPHTRTPSLLILLPCRNIYNDHEYNRPRDWRLTTSWGTNKESPESIRTSNQYFTEGFKEGPQWSPFFAETRVPPVMYFSQTRKTHIFCLSEWRLSA